MRCRCSWLVPLAFSCLSVQVASAKPEHRDSSLEREDLGTATLFQPTSTAAQHVMHGLLCQCPGCQPKRITIEDCACGYAARQREEVLAVLAAHDLSTARGRAAAERAAVDDQVDRYGLGVLAQPSTSIVWMFPLIATVGGFGILIVGGRRWRRRSVHAPAPMIIPEEDALTERLDDELAELD